MQNSRAMKSAIKQTINLNQANGISLNQANEVSWMQKLFQTKVRSENSPKNKLF